MQRAIEFLLKNQANSESRVEESNRRIDEVMRQVEETNRQIDETNKQLAQTNQMVEALAETQAAFTQSVLTFITKQVEFNTWIQRRFEELAEAQLRTQQEVSDLTKAVTNLIRFSSGNGNTPRE